MLQAAELGGTEAKAQLGIQECQLAFESLNRNLASNNEDDWRGKLYEPLVERVASVGRKCPRCVAYC